MTQTVTYLAPDRTNHVVRKLAPRLKEADYRLRKLRAAIETLAPSPDDYAGHGSEISQSNYADQVAALDDLAAFLDGTRRYLAQRDPQASVDAEPRLPLDDNPEAGNPGETDQLERRPEGDEPAGNEAPRD